MERGLIQFIGEICGLEPLQYQLDPGSLQVVPLTLEVRPGQGVGFDPAFRQAKGDPVAGGVQTIVLRQRILATALYQHCQPQHHAQAHGGDHAFLHQLLVGAGGELPPVAPDQRGQHLLLVAGEACQIGVAGDVGAVFMVLAVGDQQADFVEARRPLQHIQVSVVVQLPVDGDFLEERHGGALDAVGVLDVDGPAARHAVDASPPYVGVLDAADQIVKHAFPERQVRDVHSLDAEKIEHGP